MIRKCENSDFETIYLIINNAAEIYKGIIPEDRWKEPYISQEELQEEINAGIAFWGYEDGDELIGVMGVQPIKDVTLIRHAYVRPEFQKQGIGGKLLLAIRQETTRPLLIGTWADAIWAIRFYERHGFRLVNPAKKDHLLRKYWSIPERQIQTSVVLADQRWRGRGRIDTL